MEAVIVNGHSYLFTLHQTTETDKGSSPKTCTTFALGNEIQTVADARGDRLYGSKVHVLPGE